MNITNSKKVIEKAVDVGIVAMLWGKAGIGKSQVVREVAKAEANKRNLIFTDDPNKFDNTHYGFVDLRLGTQEVGDLIGMPFNKGGKTAWANPTWFPVHEQSQGIVFLDELNRGRLEVIQAIFQLVLDRRLHTNQLPKGWGIVSACNPTGDNYFVNELDEALLDRFININFTPDTREWIDFGKNTDRIPIGITDFIEKYPNALGNSYKNIPIEIKPTPRSWEMLGKMMKDLHEDLWLEVATALIGKEFALNFINSLRANLKRPLRAEQILNDFDKHEKDIKSLSKGKKARTDLLRMTCDDIIRVAQKEDRVKFTKEQGKNLLKFLKVIMADLAFSVVKELVKIDEMKAIFNTDNDLFNKLSNARATENAT